MKDKDLLNLLDCLDNFQAGVGGGGGAMDDAVR